MSQPSILFLPGNGHDPVRLEGARAVLADLGDPFTIEELAYPMPSTYDELLTDLGERAAEWSAEHPGGLVFATGIGGLVALSMRARGALLEHRLIIQGAVLWGLERRRFPKLMRLPGMPYLLARAFRTGRIQRRFVKRHLRSTPSADWLRRFFGGYGDAQAFAKWFRWLTPDLLRQLEQQLPAQPRALENLEAWWGEEDSVVSTEELRITERALGVTIPLRTFPNWDHYPMIDDPAGWVAELRHAVETSPALR